MSSCGGTSDGSKFEATSDDSVSDKIIFDNFGFSRFNVSDNKEIITTDNKTKLVYLTNFDTVYSNNDDDLRIYDEQAIENEVNKYLDAKGYDFYVDFITNSEFDYMTQEIHPNIEVYEQMLDNGDQVDIVNTGYGFESLGGINDTYHVFVEKGYLIPLDDYLTSDEGKELYNILGETNWEIMKVNDKIYGKTTDYDMASPLTLIFNDGYCDKYDVDKSAIKSLSDLEPYLEKMANDGYAGLYIDPTCENLYNLIDFTKFNGIYVNAQTSRAENIFQNETALTYLKQIADYKQKGYITNTFLSENMPYLCTVAPSMPIAYNSSHIISKGYLETEDMSGAVGISTSSKHPNEAFTLLTLLNTDSELADIVYNGIAERNYQSIDGIKALNKNALPFFDYTTTPSNPIIAQSNSQDNPNKLSDFELYLENSQMSPFYGLKISGELQKKLDVIAEINTNFYGLFYGNYGEYETLDNALSEVCNQLKDAGIDEISDELNNQYAAQNRGN